MRRRSHNLSAACTRIGMFAATLCAMPLLIGCAEQEEPVFSLAGTKLVWPTPPDRARIRYIGALTGEASLGRKPTALEGARAILTGPPRRAAFATPVAVATMGARIAVADPSHPSGALVHLLDLDARTAVQLREIGGAPLAWPIDVAARGERLAIADAKRAAVFVTDVSGGGARTIGSGILRRPAAVAWRADGAELWVLDAGAHAILVFDEAGRELRRFGQRGAGLGEFNFPAGLCCPNARAAQKIAPMTAIVADSMNFRVQVLGNDGAGLGTFGKKGDAAGDFSLPRDVAMDSAGHVYVLDSQFENFQIFEPDGRLLMALGREGAGRGEFSVPSGITIDDADRIWIADTYNRRVQVFAYLPEDGA